jgi:hypothetical protein
MKIRCMVVAALVAGSGMASGIALGQATTRLEYQVAVDGGPWGSLVAIQPGQRAEWRAVVTFTGTPSPVALGSIGYQPVLSNVDNTGAGDAVDSLGAFRGPPGVGSVLSEAEGDNSSPLASYGRVNYRGSTGGLDAYRHSNGSDGAPLGEYIRVASTGFPTWNSSGNVVTLNSSAVSTNFIAGTQSMVIFRQAFIASTDIPADFRFITLSSSANPGSELARWALQGEGGSTASLTTGIEFVSATIQVVPSPAGLALAGVAGLGLLRRSRR